MWRDELNIGPRCVERFLTTEALPELQQVGINLAGISVLREEYLVSRKNPQEHLALLTLSGEGQLHVPSGSQLLKTGQLLILPLGQAYSFEIKAAHWRHVWLLLSPKQRWLQIPESAQVKTVESSTGLVSSMQLLLQQQSQPRQNPHIVKSLVDLLQRYLMTMVQTNKPIVEDNPLVAIEQQMRSALHYPWTVQEIARRINVSEPHCYRLFQRYFQMSPKQFLRRLRMEHGAYLLRESGWSLDVIASQLGYQDGFAFSHRFKKYMGLSPAAFRLRSKGKSRG
ncbi:AraC family transcriptional regulator [Alginatibacterium sediminis]|uniref:AraC family transcriptional regulator n=1 Tax=Alginatibacterium sediminis TaxID=2164068 RepID=A0A420E746_9ALTE|nr:AraC family transcriptional regulator [Alginatibacterium sediminis]RKF14470.1 AraC family transcriptional regulator [Alginatibacterium sediminis]